MRIILIIIICYSSILHVAWGQIIKNNTQQFYHGELFYPKKSLFKFYSYPSGNIIFKGKAKISALLLGGWSIVDYFDPKTPIKEFRLHVLIDKETFNQFPSYKNYPLKENYKVFYITNNKYDEKNYDQFFDTIPRSFLEKKKGILIQPVEILVSNYAISGECDYLSYFFDIEFMKKIDFKYDKKAVEYYLNTEKGCGATDYDK